MYAYSFLLESKSIKREAVGQPSEKQAACLQVGAWGCGNLFKGT